MNKCFIMGNMQVPFLSLTQETCLHMPATSSSNVKINVHYNTLSTYLFQEIIQNADDAGASTVHFYLDNRTHGTHSLVEPQLAMFQGPSLLAYNDAIFQDKDWQSIQDMQQPCLHACGTSQPCELAGNCLQSQQDG